MALVYPPKAAAIEAGKLLRLFITQNIDIHTRLRTVLRNQRKGKGQLLMIGVDERWRQLKVVTASSIRDLVIYLCAYGGRNK